MKSLTIIPYIVIRHYLKAIFTFKQNFELNCEICF